MGLLPVGPPDTSSKGRRPVAPLGLGISSKGQRQGAQAHANAVLVPDTALRQYVDDFEWPTDDEDATVISTG